MRTRHRIVRATRNGGLKRHSASCWPPNGDGHDRQDSMRRSCNLANPCDAPFPANGGWIIAASILGYSMSGYARLKNRKRTEPRSLSLLHLPQNDGSENRRRSGERI